MLERPSRSFGSGARQSRRHAYPSRLLSLAGVNITVKIDDTRSPSSLSSLQERGFRLVFIVCAVLEQKYKSIGKCTDEFGFGRATSLK